MANSTPSRRAAQRLAVALLSVIVLAGCSTQTAEQGAASSGPAPITPGFEHVHGLGADPLTGNTYAATHHGVWLIPTGTLLGTYLEGAPRSTTVEPTQVAGRAQDTMGFTVAAPGLLLASGHPAPAEQTDLKLPNLGLISSTDGANSWTALSLEGETDFHDLAVAPLADSLRVYGYDAGEGAVSVSDDSGTTWSAGAVLPLRDLTVDTARPDRVYATTADGLALSDDIGQTFSIVAGAPALLLVEVVDGAEGGGLVGVDAQGTVWRQEGMAGTWTQTGSTTGGAPEAFTYVGGSAGWILVASAEGISASEDYGQTWTELVSLTG